MLPAGPCMRPPPRLCPSPATWQGSVRGGLCVLVVLQLCVCGRGAAVCSCSSVRGRGARARGATGEGGAKGLVLLSPIPTYRRSRGPHRRVWKGKARQALVCPSPYLLTCLLSPAVVCSSWLCCAHAIRAASGTASSRIVRQAGGVCCAAPLRLPSLSPPPTPDPSLQAPKTSTWLERCWTPSACSKPRSLLRQAGAGDGVCNLRYVICLCRCCVCPPALSLASPTPFLPFPSTFRPCRSNARPPCAISRALQRCACAALAAAC